MKLNFLSTKKRIFFWRNKNLKFRSFYCCLYLPYQDGNCFNFEIECSYNYIVIVEKSDTPKNRCFFLIISVLLCVDHESEIGFWGMALEILIFDDFIPTIWSFYVVLNYYLK